LRWPIASGRETDPLTVHRVTSVFTGFWVPREVIAVAVRWYLGYGLSYLDVEELLAELGITVDHVNNYRWGPAAYPEIHRGCPALPLRSL
jgi:transposase-like protein